MYSLYIGFFFLRIAKSKQNKDGWGKVGYTKAWTNNIIFKHFLKISIKKGKKGIKKKVRKESMKRKYEWKKVDRKKYVSKILKRH